MDGRGPGGACRRPARLAILELTVDDVAATSGAMLRTLGSDSGRRSWAVAPRRRIGRQRSVSDHGRRSARRRGREPVATIHLA